MKQRSKALFTVAGAFIVLAAMLYSCGGGGGGYGGSYSAPPPPPTTSTVQVVACSSVTPAATVSATEYAFTSSTVHAPIGGVVMWTNNGTMTHSVTSGTAGTSNGQFSQDITPGQSVCLKFTTAGTYNYFCRFHYSLGMIGSVTVP